MISLHPHQIKSIECAPIMFYGIKKYTDEVGTLWVRLADYYIKLGLFEKTRDVFEEALNSIQNMKDFSLVFSAYVKFEENLIALIQEDDEEEDDDLDDNELASKLNKILRITDDEEPITLADEVNLKLYRLELLLDRRPLLLNSCALR
jgi:pre-mRNA-splicing factor SYF1